MADKRHTYSIRVDWTGNQGTGTSAYRAYSRARDQRAGQNGHSWLVGSSIPRGCDALESSGAADSFAFPLSSALVPASLR
jgi:hypothetical protein